MRKGKKKAVFENDQKLGIGREFVLRISIS